MGPAASKHYYMWDPPGAPAAVLLNLDLVDPLARWAAGARATGERVRGVLLGRVETNSDRTVVVIEDCEPARTAISAGRAVGLFTTGDSLAGDFAELALVTADPNGVLLRLQGEQGSYLFTGEEQPSGPAFRFRRDALAAERGRILPSPPADVPVKRRMPKAAIGGLGAALLAFGLWGMYRTLWPVPPSTASAQGPLRLGLETNGPALIVTWDPNSSAVAAGNRGVLRIYDGPLQRTMDLDPQQLRSGRAAYVPVHADLRFELEVMSAQGQTTGSLRRVALPVQLAAASPEAAPPAAEAKVAEQPLPAGKSNPVRLGQAGGKEDEADRSANPPRVELSEPAAAPADVASASPPPEGAPPEPPPAPVKRTPAPAPPAVSVFYEPARESLVRRAIGKVPGVLRFRRNKAETRFEPAKPVHSAKPSVRGAPSDGVVRLEVFLNDKGKVDGVEVLSPRADDHLTGLATTAVYNSRFEPARLNGKPVESKLVATFGFGDAAVNRP